MKLHAVVWAAVQLLDLAVAGPALRGKPSDLILPYKREPLQNLVTWDEHSIFVKGERVFFYSGEFHPYRLPVPGLWLDVFQKIKSLGYNGVSFYTSMSLHEGEEGVFRADGIFGYQQFFDAASEAGIYLLARPGPYINAEVSGGGFPGWLTRIDGQYRTNDTAYLEGTANYAKSIAEIIAKAQITNGGPVILFQPENEYTNSNGEVLFPNRQYFADVEQQFRDGGIVVPFISNDASPKGYLTPGSGLGAVDLYGYDGYPLGFDCSNPSVWPDNALPTNFRTLHLQQSPSTPNAIIEFQGGAFDPWGGVGFEKCTSLLNSEFENVFYKNNFGAGLTLFNIYMTYGGKFYSHILVDSSAYEMKGTNWGNLGHPSGYTSYDYGAVIKEDRTVAREKYSAAKLLANGITASPEFLTAIAANTSTAGSYADNRDITVWPLFSNKTGFYVVRHSAYNSVASTNYKLTLPTSQGNVTVPQLGGSLALNGRDSKVSVSDLPVGKYNLLYNTADIFTYKTSGSRTVLVVFGGRRERHELAFSGAPRAIPLEGTGTTIDNVKDTTVINWQATSTRKVVKVGNDLYVYLLDRNTAYNYWVIDAPSSAPKYPSQGWDWGYKGWGRFAYSGNSGSSQLVLRAGYLIRSAQLSGSSLALVGDLNATAPLEIISGAPAGLQKVTFNGKQIQFKQNSQGVVTATLSYIAPSFQVPTLSKQSWSFVDSLPEVQATYDDSAWTIASNPTTPNIEYQNLSTPTSLYSTDYGFSIGTLVYRGHFTSNGNEKSFFVRTQGGFGYGASVWLNSTYIGSWAGSGAYGDHNDTFKIPFTLSSGKPYVLTVVIDTMGLNENYGAGDIGGKAPRGILNYSLDGRPQEAVTWKLTGNLGGEKYIDKARGPLNEGGLFAERQGFHLPKAPVKQWKNSSPYDGLKSAGIGFYYTEFDLKFPSGYDIPLSFAFDNSTSGVDDYRAILYVNGYQFGKYVANIGPQTEYPVPEGILNHQGTNYVGLLLWSQQDKGAKLPGFSLKATATVQSGYGQVEAAPQPAWSQRSNAY